MSDDQESLRGFLADNLTIKIIRLQWLDYSGVLRARFVPTERCLRIASGDEEARMAQAGMIVPISTAPRIFSITDYHETWYLRPDWSSLEVCGFRPVHATVMCCVDQKDSDVRFDKCPRSLLKRALERLAETYGANMRIGFEIEFVMLDESNTLIKPLDRLSGYCRPAGLRAETLDIVEEIVAALEISDISIHQFHAEAGEQLEIALAVEPALQALDSLVMAQEAIRTICMRHGIQASMAPTPVLDGEISGLHMHISFDRLDDDQADSFLAGILNHMHSLCAIGMAGYDSYVRSVADCAGEWIGYGTDNRDLPVRKIDDKHWELRMLDATANPYLFAAATLLAGLDGLEKRIKLSWKDLQKFPHLLDEEQRKEYGIDKRMPRSLAESLDALRQDDSLISRIGKNLVKWYLHVKDKDVEEFAKMTEEQRRTRYLEYF